MRSGAEREDLLRAAWALSAFSLDLVVLPQSGDGKVSSFRANLRLGETIARFPKVEELLSRGADLTRSCLVFSSSALSF